ncbi:hypothetical protein AA0311_1412 [Asaia bogorensis NBRC 16594]|uniref:Uncharacterized protein n=1 Tax=Asaia bogorensis NBRC 16594 TaxID=1231624 RepID=A0AAN4R3P1_9PROT|nr:hypothetical protein AA0311_1412 [Asaia bogorensis NBRC 16594]GEL54264.1 hypothetical protein ABO01nite_22710 [Asaia bogorensis NBRC 16594]
MPEAFLAFQALHPKPAFDSAFNLPPIVLWCSGALVLWCSGALVIYTFSVPGNGNVADEILRLVPKECRTTEGWLGLSSSLVIVAR